MWGSQKKNWGKKSIKDFSGWTQEKKMKKLLFSALPCFEKLRNYLNQKSDSVDGANSDVGRTLGSDRE